MRRDLVTFSLAALIGCGSAEQGVSPQTERGSTDRQATDDPVVARVGRVPILASAVARQARLSSASPEAALQDLIDVEVLAAEARRRGYHRGGEAVEAARRAAVRQLLEQTFERDYTPDRVSESELEALYQKRRRRYVHPELRDVVHALAAVSESAPQDDHRRSRQWAEGLVGELAGLALTPEEFKARAERRARGDLRVVVERLATARHGTTVEEFARAAFDLKRPGAIGGPVRTSFGYHVIYLASIEPAEDRPFSEVRAEILRETWPELRRRAFERFVEELRRGHDVSIDEAPLEEPTG